MSLSIALVQLVETEISLIYLTFSQTEDIEDDVNVFAVRDIIQCHRWDSRKFYLFARVEFSVESAEKIAILIVY